MFLNYSATSKLSIGEISNLYHGSGYADQWKYPLRPGGANHRPENLDGTLPNFDSS